MATKKFMPVVTITTLVTTQGADPKDKTKIIKLNRWRLSRLKQGEKHSASLSKPDFCIITAPESVKDCPVKIGQWVECELRHPIANDAEKTETSNFYFTKAFDDEKAKNAYRDSEISAEIEDDMDYQVELQKAERLATARNRAAKAVTMPANLANGM